MTRQSGGWIVRATSPEGRTTRLLARSRAEAEATRRELGAKGYRTTRPRTLRDALIEDRIDPNDASAVRRYLNQENGA